MKKTMLPILIIIPHGGYRVPEELSGLEAVNNFDLFIQADTCANDLFSLGDAVIATMNTDISRLFIDLDRSYHSIPLSENGVIKKRTPFGKDVFTQSNFPDEIAIANILKRYYFPFHEALNKIIGSGDIKLILECHTVMPVGPKISPDPGKPRPIASIENVVEIKQKTIETCQNSLAHSFLEHLRKSLAGEYETATDPFILNGNPSSGYILKTFGGTGIPMMRLSLSKSLFLTDTYFSLEYLRVDEHRIELIKKLILNALTKFFAKSF